MLFGTSSENLYCQKHNNSNIQFICAVNNCKQTRKICQICKQKQSLHISYHSNYIFKIKQFFDFNQSKLVIPRLQKGIQDLDVFIQKHKKFYKEQILKINQDFDLFVKKFAEITEQYKKIYIQNFQKEIDAFDEQFLEIVNNLKVYANQKSHQQSFFTKLFTNDKSSNDIEEIVNKNQKGFDVRASIIVLKSKLTQTKISKTAYKTTQRQQSRFNQLLQYIQVFCTTFYDNFKDLLVVNNENVPTSPDKKNLKNSIVTQTKSLSTSRVSSMKYFEMSNLEQMNPMRRSLVVGEKQLIKCKLPEINLKVLEIMKYLKPSPNFTQTSGQKQEGPYRYQTGVYLGHYQNSIRNGRGIFIFDDGSYYEGNWQGDKMCGYGRLIKKNSYYEGDIKDGFANGKGNYQDTQKTYSGEWKNDLRHGVGQEEFKNKKRKYKGGFWQDKYNGKGKLFDEDFIYEGEFKSGVFQGEGLLKYNNGQSFRGSLKDGQRIFGKHTFADGSYYEGTFRDNMPNGNGQFSWPDGIKYSGQWKQGLQQGIGVETLANGKELKGLWQNGSWVKWI